METNTSDKKEFSLRAVLITVFKRKKILLAFFFITVAVVSVVTFIVTPTFQATAQILVKVGRESIYIPTSGNTSPVININREERVNSEVEILQSRSLAEGVIMALGPTAIYEDLKKEDPGLRDKIYDYVSQHAMVEKWDFAKRMLSPRQVPMTPNEKKESRLKLALLMFQEDYAVAAVKKSNLINVSFKHPDPRMAAIVVNNLTSIFVDHHLAAHKSPQNVKFFREQSQLLKSKLMQAEGSLKSLKEKFNITSLDEEQTLLLNQVANLRTELNKTLSREVEAEKRIHKYKQQLAVTPKTVSRGMETNQNPLLINTLEARLVELELKEKEVGAKYTDQSRLVQSVREEIRVVRERLREQESKSYGSSVQESNRTYMSLQESLFKDEAELTAIKAKSETQKKHLAAHQRKLEQINQIEIELKQLEQEVDVNRKNYRLYLSKYEESRISDAMDTERISSVTVLEQARPPLKPLSPNKKLNILLGFMLGAIGGLGLAFFLEILDGTMDAPEDIEHLLGTPVLASVPKLPRRVMRAYLSGMKV